MLIQHLVKMKSSKVRAIFQIRSMLSSINNIAAIARWQIFRDVFTKSTLQKQNLFSPWHALDALLHIW